MQMFEDIWPQSLLLVWLFIFTIFFFLQIDDEESFIWTLIWPFFDVLVDVVEVVFLWENTSCNFFALELDVFSFNSVNSVDKFGFVCSSVHVLFIICGDFKRCTLFLLYFV
jgi:hypothetical protein